MQLLSWETKVGVARYCRAQQPSPARSAAVNWYVVDSERSSRQAACLRHACAAARQAGAAHRQVKIAKRQLPAGTGLIMSASRVSGFSSAPFSILCFLTEARRHRENIKALHTQIGAKSFLEFLITLFNRDRNLTSCRESSFFPFSCQSGLNHGLNETWTKILMQIDRAVNSRCANLVFMHLRISVSLCLCEKQRLRSNQVFESSLSYPRTVDAKTPTVVGTFSGGMAADTIKDRVKAYLPPACHCVTVGSQAVLQARPYSVCELLRLMPKFPSAANIARSVTTPALAEWSK